MKITIATRLNANCGCGVEYRQGETPTGMALPLVTADQVVKAAQAHANMLGHTMHMTGEIKATHTVLRNTDEYPRRRERKREWSPRKDQE